MSITVDREARTAPLDGSSGFVFANPASQEKAIRPTAIESLPVSSLRAPIDPLRLGEILRSRLVQIALDVSSLDQAIRLTELALEGGADIIEVGDPLIKRFGMEAVRLIRARYKDIPLVVEFSSSDWAEEQVSLVSKEGADIVLMLGLLTEARVERAVYAARQAKVGLIVELPRTQPAIKWSQMAQNLGVDGLAVIRNIDSATTAAASLRRVQSVRNKIDIPIAVSGGFTPTHILEALGFPWNIMIVGRAVVDAPDPKSVVRRIVSLVQNGRI